MQKSLSVYLKRQKAQRAVFIQTVRWGIWMRSVQCCTKWLELVTVCVCGGGSVFVCVCVCVWERERRVRWSEFSVMVLDLLMPTRTASGLPVRKSNSQLHREVLRDDCVKMLNWSLWTAFWHTSLFLSRCVRAGWRAVAMVSSVERLDRYANWKGSREGWRDRLDVVHD